MPSKGCNFSTFVRFMAVGEQERQKRQVARQAILGPAGRSLITAGQGEADRKKPSELAAGLVVLNNPEWVCCRKSWSLEAMDSLVRPWRFYIGGCSQTISPRFCRLQGSPRQGGEGHEH